MKFRRSYNMRLCVSCKTTTSVKRTVVLLSKLLQGRATSHFSLKLYLGVRIVWMMKTLFSNLLQVGKILHRDKWLPMSLLHSSNLTSFLLPLNSPHSPNSRHLTCKKQAAISLLISHLHYNNLVIAWRRDKRFIYKRFGNLTHLNKSCARFFVISLDTLRLKSWNWCGNHFYLLKNSVKGSFYQRD